MQGQDNQSEDICGETPGEEPVEISCDLLALDLIATVEIVGFYKTANQKAHPKVFQGLGQFGEPYSTKLRPDAQPHAMFIIPRRVPLPLRHKRVRVCSNLCGCTETQFKCAP